MNKDEELVTESKKEHKTGFKFSLMRRASLLMLFLILPITLIPTKSIFLYNSKTNLTEKDKTISFRQYGVHEELKQIQKNMKTKPDYPVPLDSFLINLSQKKEQKLFKLEMELNVDNPEIQYEINKRMVQVRDIIIILISSKKYEQIVTLEGREILKEEIKDTVNSFLTKGKINRVLFKEFIET